MRDFTAQAAAVPHRPFRREDGILVQTEGDVELRLHLDTAGWHVHRWLPDPFAHDGWRGPVAYGLTAVELVALGAAAEAL